MDTNEIFSGERSQLNNQIQSNFSDRQKNLFDQLKKAEDVNKPRLSSPVIPMDIDVNATNNRNSNKRKRSETKYFQGKESIFKRPEEPLSKCLPPRRIPDFRKNPHKWTKYSLDDVPNEDTSDRGNTAAALSFLREMEERKQSENDAIEDAPEPIANTKVQFNKSALLQRKKKDEEKLSFKGTKIVMPEYVVGQVKKSTKKAVSAKSQSKSDIKEIKLDHLNEEEDCDE